MRDREATMQAWRDAYRAANGMEPPKITYENGWYIIHGQRYRHGTLETMIQTLRYRAKEENHAP